MCYERTGTLDNHSVQDRPARKENTIKQEHEEKEGEKTHDLFYINLHSVTGNETRWRYL